MLRLDVELWTDDGKRLGLLARLRDLLPGRYAIGLTGRGPGGKVLAPGAYRLRVFAWPTGGGRPTVRSVPFTDKRSDAVVDSPPTPAHRQRRSV